MRITFSQLEQFARERGYSVERTGRRIEWWRNEDHSMIGVCESVIDTYSEIVNDYNNKRQGK